MTQILVKASDGTYRSADILHGSSFALEINQPLLDTEHVPVPFSTDISFPPTKTNKELFRYIPVLMAEPGEKELEAAIVVDGVAMTKGMVTYTGIDSGNLQYAFSGKNVEDEWKRKIWDPSDDLVNKVVKAASKDIYNRPYANGYVRFPTILDKKYGQLLWGSYSNADRAYYRYYNWNPEVGTEIYERGLPVVYLKALISQAAEALTLNGPVQSMLNYLGICGQYGTYRQERFGTNILTVPGLVRSKVFTALPDVSVAEVVKDLLRMTCCSLFRTGSGYEIVSASDILTSEAADYSDKISDIYSASVESGKAYSLTYGGAEESEDDATESPANYSSLKALLDSVLVTGSDLGDLKSVRHSSLKDVYSLCGLKYGYTNGPATAGSITSRYLGRIGSDAENSETFDSSIGLTPVECIPDYVPIRTASAGGYTENSTPRVIPVLEAPSADNERGKDCLVGLVYGYQMCDKGLLFNSSSGTDRDLGVSLAIDRLYSDYHSGFASWVSRNRQTVRAELNFNALDIANVRMDRRVKFAGRYWLIKKISVTVTAGGRLKTEGEFIEA